MLVVKELHCELVEEDGLSFLKGNTMFPKIVSRLDWVSFKFNHQHIVLKRIFMSSQATICNVSKCGKFIAANRHPLDKESLQ
jgi:hypothetical protein